MQSTRTPSLKAITGIRFFSKFILMVAIIILASCDTSVPTLPGTPTAIPSGWIRRENAITQRRLVEQSTPRINNCSGGSTSNEISRGRSTTVVMSLSISAEVEANILTAVKGTLGAEFNVEEGETISANNSVTLTLNEPMIVNYVIQWYETWEVGTVVIDNLELSFPYEVRVGIDADIIGNQRETCLTPSPSNTFSPTPIPTDTPPATWTPTWTIFPQPTAIPTIDLSETAQAMIVEMTVSAVFAGQTSTADEAMISTQAAMTVSALYAQTGTPPP